MLDILIEVDRICKKHNIKYWLSSGTLLGAVKHGGFIPWDDDLDIELLREDYIRLLKILQNELPEQFALQTEKTAPRHLSYYAKVRDKKSAFFDTLPQGRIQKYQGAFIDIFPLERSWEWCHKISKVFFNLYTWKLIEKKGFLFGLYTLLRSFQTYILHPLLRMISITAPRNILRHSLGVYFNSTRLGNEIFPLTEIEFESYKFPIPKNSDAYLTRLFGNYMELPCNIEFHFYHKKIELC